MTQYKLVPVEPTTDMLRSGVQRELADASHYGRLRDTYRAMLAAAPEAPQPAKLVDHLRLAERFEALHAKGDVWITTIAAAYMARMGATEAPQPAKRELTHEEIFELAEPFGEFQYGDAQGDKRIDFARAILAAYERKNGIGGQT